jgi:hypothetical protein
MITLPVENSETDCQVGSEAGLAGSETCSWAGCLVGCGFQSIDDFAMVLLFHNMLTKHIAASSIQDSLVFLFLYTILNSIFIPEYTICIKSL